MLSVIYADYRKVALNAESCYAACHYAECRMKTVVMLSVVMLSVEAPVQPLSYWRATSFPSK